MKGRQYGIRMREELMFMDCKTGGWQWQNSRVWYPERAAVLWLVMSAAYVWMLSLGARVCRSESLRKNVVGRKWRVVNVFRLGLELFSALPSDAGANPLRVKFANQSEGGLKKCKAVRFSHWLSSLLIRSANRVA